MSKNVVFEKLQRVYTSLKDKLQSDHNQDEESSNSSNSSNVRVVRNIKFNSTDSVNNGGHARVIVLGGFAIKNVFQDEITTLQRYIEYSPAGVGMLLNLINTEDIDVKIIADSEDVVMNVTHRYVFDLYKNLTGGSKPTKVIKTHNYRDTHYIWAIYAGKIMDVSVHVQRYVCIDLYSQYISKNSSIAYEGLSRNVSKFYHRSEVYASKELTRFNTLHMLALVIDYLCGGDRNNRVAKAAKLIARTFLVTLKHNHENTHPSFINTIQQSTKLIDKMKSLLDLLSSGKSNKNVSKIKSIRLQMSCLLCQQIRANVDAFTMLKYIMKKTNICANQSVGGANSNVNHVKKSNTLQQPDDMLLLESTGYLYDETINDNTSMQSEREIDKMLEPVLLNMAVLLDMSDAEFSVATENIMNNQEDTSYQHTPLIPQPVPVMVAGKRNTRNKK